MPDEVDASINGLEDRLRGVEPGAKAGQELLNPKQPFIELLWRVMQQHEVVDVPDVVLHAERVLAELVQSIEVDVREELRGEVSDRQAKVRRLRREPLVLRHPVEQMPRAANLVVVAWVVPEHLQGQGSKPRIGDPPF